MTGNLAGRSAQGAGGIGQKKTRFLRPLRPAPCPRRPDLMEGLLK